MIKNIRKQTDIIIGGKDNLENFILPVVRELSRAPNEIVFDKLSDAATTQWENDGEGLCHVFPRCLLMQEVEKLVHRMHAYTRIRYHQQPDRVLESSNEITGIYILLKEIFLPVPNMRILYILIHQNFSFKTHLPIR